MPDVRGETGEIAESLLNEAQLNSRTQGEPSEEPVGTVLSQSERGGENVKCGTTVLLSVSTGQETTKPDVGTGG